MTQSAWNAVLDSLWDFHHLAGWSKVPGVDPREVEERMLAGGYDDIDRMLVDTETIGAA